jgi:hypothetical protein
MDRVTANAWSKLEFFDPTGVLRELRAVEERIAPSIQDPRIRALRTHGLKNEREARDAAIFAHGMGEAVLQTKLLLAPVEGADYDFVTTWEDDDVRHYCPVQLKELVPTELNEHQSLEQLFHGLGKYANSQQTVVAIKLNRRFRIELSEIAVPDLAFAGIWLFGATAPDQSTWFLYGDVLRDPVPYAFSYPA